MTDSQEGAEPKHSPESWIQRYKWTSTCSVETFVSRMKSFREGGATMKPQPANAVRALHAFAVLRRIDELVQSATKFDHPQDAINMLAVAALCREPWEAAALAVEQYDTELREEGGVRATPYTDGIIHDVACQRTAVDVATFIRKCSESDRPQLVDKTLDAFIRPSSGRTHLDKALLHIALRGEGCDDAAGDLLHRTLEAIDTNGATGTAEADPAEFRDLVGSLRRLSPSERILEKWVDKQLDVPDHVPPTRRIVAALIAGSQDGEDTLAEHVGTRLSENHVAGICSHLTKEAPAKCRLIREHVAARVNLDDLAKIVKEWHRPDGVLAGTTKELLADVVARGGAGRAGPRPVADLESLATALGNVNADPECRRLLWNAAAAHTEGRSGADLAHLLCKVEQSSDRRRAERTIARRLAVHLLKEDAEADLFVDYVDTLRRSSGAGAETAVHLARKELADPSAADWAQGSARIVGRIVAGLYDRRLMRDGEDLLERCLENEQLITPEDVCAIVRQLRDSAMPEEARFLVLRATVGRWSDVLHRDQTVDELKDQGFDAEADQVIRSLR
ncbi:hypothetical protein [Streptomyces sp. NPDC001604]|uniref:hypothetical protein n=1 Tax=Streptomyces sp. NPDC001604 TaxID=3364593 RepID=UPI0036991DA6